MGEQAISTEGDKKPHEPVTTHFSQKFCILVPVLPPI